MCADSTRPTCRTLPSVTARRNCPRFSPAPTWRWSGSLRAAASTTRVTETRRTRAHGAVSARASASIAKPGLTPVASTETFLLRASRSRSLNAAARAGTGQASSSQVVRTFVRSGHERRDLRLDVLEQRGGADEGDVGADLLEEAVRVALDLDPELARQAQHRPQVLARVQGRGVRCRHQLQARRLRARAGDAPGPSAPARRSRPSGFEPSSVVSSRASAPPRSAAPRARASSR